MNITDEKRKVRIASTELIFVQFGATCNPSSPMLTTECL